jgi:hypothetical protein
MIKFSGSPAADRAACPLIPTSEVSARLTFCGCIKWRDAFEGMAMAASNRIAATTSPKLIELCCGVDRVGQAGQCCHCPYNGLKSAASGDHYLLRPSYARDPKFRP